MQLLQLIQHVGKVDRSAGTLQAAIHLHVYELPNSHVVSHVSHYVPRTVLGQRLHIAIHNQLKNLKTLLLAIAATVTGSLRASHHSLQ